MKSISSSSNEDFIQLKSLATTKGQNKNQSFLLMGEKLIREHLTLPKKFSLLGEVRTPQLAALTSAPQWILSPALFKEVDIIGTHFNLLILEKPSLDSFDLRTPPKGLELLCPVGDPANLGAVLRSALAFGVSRVVLTQEAANPFHPKSLKASAGAALQLNLSRTGSLLEMDHLIPEISAFTSALDLNGTPINQFSWPQNSRLLIGEEGPGLPPLKGLPRLTISTHSVESLNVAVAASIAFYAYQTWQK